MPPVRIDVASASRTYPVLVAPGLISDLETHLSAAGIGARRFVVSSPNVWRRHGETIATALPGTPHLLIPDGERSKNQQTLGRIYEWLIGAGADRHSVVIAVGGGVIGDTVGFGAASYLRGVDLVQVPTTLLAQVDSSIGGKVGINHALGKNLIGAFHAPVAVVIDPSLLDTLPRREMRAGLYEVVKYGVIASRPLFEQLSNDLSRIFARDPDVMTGIIAQSCRIKADVVADDEREGDRRRILNYGHTAGHALEAVTRYRRLRHGEAVGYGMLVAAELGVRRKLLSEADREALSTLIGNMGPLPSVSDLSADELITAMHRDKKVVEGRLHMVLPRGIGDTQIADDVSDRDIRRALKVIGIR
ncbi:MAG: 3-dehydroquinate synthase [Acidobacteria bacterium]|nr:3-dehydroquinate synthase [Acidobacteriota bacterium]